MLSLRSIISSLTIFATIWSICEQHLTVPSCDVVSFPNHTTFPHTTTHPDDLNVILVSNLLIAPSDSSFRTFFLDFFFNNFFQKSFELLKPDMLVVLGDVSATGYNLTKQKWSHVLQRFEAMLGPYLDLPLHVTMGDRDIGECDKLKHDSVHKAASSFPDLDSAGCGSFEIGNISFVSLNTVALLCGNNELLSDVETVIERESAYLRMRNEGDESIAESYATGKMCLSSDGGNIQHYLNLALFFCFTFLCNKYQKATAGKRVSTPYLVLFQKVSSYHIVGYMGVRVYMT